MSHVVGIKITVKDLGALKRAAANMGLEFMGGQTTHKWFGKWLDDWAESNAAYKLGVRPEDYGKCLHAIRMKNNPDAYEIGVVKNRNGDGYILVFDFFAQSSNITAICGEDLRRLLKEYECEVVTADHGVQELLNQGYTIQKDVRENGDITIQITNEA